MCVFGDGVLLLLWGGGGGACKLTHMLTNSALNVVQSFIFCVSG